jgi:hypothetical protein
MPRDDLFIAPVLDPGTGAEPVPGRYDEERGYRVDTAGRALVERPGCAETDIITEVAGERESPDADPAELHDEDVEVPTFVDDENEDDGKAAGRAWSETEPVTKRLPDERDAFEAWAETSTGTRRAPETDDVPG